VTRIRSFVGTWAAAEAADNANPTGMIAVKNRRTIT
jgi:hypothetical protein